MRPAKLAGSLAALTLLTAGIAAAQQTLDPMAALREAPPYNALQPGMMEPPAEAHVTDSPPPAAVYDPMRAATQPPGGGGAVVAGGSPNPELGGLPDGPGAEETYYQCVACHSTAIIMQQRITDARWDYLWRWMIEDQGMIEPDAETTEVILAYLKQHFSSER